MAGGRLAGTLLLGLVLAAFFFFGRAGELEALRADLHASTEPEVECFQGFCVEIPPGEPTSWVDFSATYLSRLALGLVLALLAAGITRTLLTPAGNLGQLGWRVGLARPRSLDSLVPVLLMAALLATLMLGAERVVQGVVGGLVFAFVVGTTHRLELDERGGGGRPSIAKWLRAMFVSSLGYVVVVGPLAVAAVFLGGLAGSKAAPGDVTAYLGNSGGGVAVGAALGLVVGAWPLGAAPLVVLLAVLGAGVAPVATLLAVTLVSGPFVYWRRFLVLMPARPEASGQPGASLPREDERQAPVSPGARLWSVMASVWMVGAAGIVLGLAVWGLAALTAEPGPSDQAEATSRLDGPGVDGDTEAERVAAERGQSLFSEGGVGGAGGGERLGDVEGQSTSVDADVLFRSAPVRYAPLGGTGGAPGPSMDEAWLAEPVVPFRDVAPEVLGEDGRALWNDRPGVAVFDFDRDGDQDFYLTQRGGRPNYLYRNNGDGTFTDVAEAVGVDVVEQQSTGVTACDVNNDGYQDLYVGGWADPDQKLDYRTESTWPGAKDRLFMNNKNGTFRDITDPAFGDAANIRSATTVSCADVDNDGWVDFFIGNLLPQAFRDFGSANHPGHYSVLYRNNGDLTFTDIAEEAGVRGSRIVMRAPDGKPYMFKDPVTGVEYEGWDPTFVDQAGNVVGDPTGQTHSSMFFDYDDDGDVDLFIAKDGDRFHVYRNDTTPGRIRFTDVAKAMGLDMVGAWMGFAIGDIDSDADLDVFVADFGYHSYLRAPMRGPSGSCEYQMRFLWGTCQHMLLRNDGVMDIASVGTVGAFRNIAPSTKVSPSPYMPPDSLRPELLPDLEQLPTGLAAYDFGFGTTFFDMENDGDQDLYWLGSDIASGEGPGGDVFPSAGRLMRGDGRGNFQDVTVEAQVLDIANVNYGGLSDELLRKRTASLRISPKFHENGKGAAHGDLNGDGYVDLIATNASGPVWENSGSTRVTQMPGPVFVWLNGGGPNHWLTLRLVGRMAIDGTGSNADGIGARVYVVSATGADGAALTQVQEVRAGSSYLSMDSIDLEFGLGQAAKADKIVIFWPSGRVQTLTDVPAGQVLRIEEPAG